MPLRLEDGYTIAGVTTGDDFSTGDKLPTVVYEYRPATSAQTAQYRRDLSAAKTGADEVKVRAEFCHEHLVSWDVENAKGDRAPITVEALAKLPEMVLLDLCVGCSRWKPKEQEPGRGQEEAGKN